jgi:hypothetical protein
MSPRLDKLARYLDGDRPDAPLRDRFATGALVGALFASFTPLLLLLWAIGGREITSRGGQVVRVDLLAAIYPLGAVVTGALLFGLTALVRARVLRALLGAVAFLPWVAGIALCMNAGHVVWRPMHTVATILMALAFGVPIGWGMTPRLGRPPNRRSRRPAV